MKSEKYISMRPNINGFSFANLGLFTGFGDGIISAVYSLILLDIWKSTSVVGLYSSAYFAFGLLVQIFFGEFLRRFSKSWLFYSSLLAIVICYVMLSFSIRPATFVALDFFTAVPLAFIAALIPLFMSDFAGKDGMAKMNGRYHTWLSVGALFAPVIAMSIAARFGNRSAFFASAAMYLLGLFLFKRYKIVQEEKLIPKLSPRRTMRTVFRGIKSYFANPSLRRAYIVNFGCCAVRSLRILYVPILIIQNGFSLDTLGIVLTISVLPYVLLSDPVGALARRWKGLVKWGMAATIISFTVLSAMLYFARGREILILIVIWHIFGAVQEALRDLLFFDVAKRDEQARFFGVFTTSGSFPRVATPLIGAAFIFLFGGTEAIWLVTFIIGILTSFALLWRPKNSIIKKRN